MVTAECYGRKGELTRLSLICKIRGVRLYDVIIMLPNAEFLKFGEVPETEIKILQEESDAEG